MSEENNFHDEEQLEKSYDSKLMKRLLSYAKPYRIFFAIALLLLFATTITDLSGPLIMKRVIDNYLSGYKGYVVFDSDPALPIENIIDKATFKRVSNVTPENKSRIYSIVYKEKKVYLVRGIVSNTSKSGNIIKDPVKGFTFRSGNNDLPAKLLNREQIKVLRHDDIDAVKKYSLFFIGIIILGFLMNVSQIYVLSYTSQTIIFNMRMQIFNHLLRMPLSFFDKNPVGRLVTRVINDTENLNDMYTNVIVNLIKDISLLLGISFIMLRLNFKLALIVLAVLPIVAVSAAIFRIKARAVYRSVRTAIARINSSLAEYISGMRVIQIFSREKENFAEFEKVNTDYYKIGMREVLIYGIFRPLNDLIAALCLSVLLWYAGGDYLKGMLQFGVLYAFINYVTMFFQPINDLSEKYNILQSSMASSERIFMLLDSPTEEDTLSLPCSTDEKSCFKGEIEFKNVWFAYNDEEWVLRDVSFKIPKGHNLAIVGATGAGKTSIINLINRMYDIQKGEILIDGINIKNIDKEFLRKNVSVVLQDVFLFSGTINDNIRLNDNNISDDDIIKASKYVNADNFILRLNNGYLEEVKERGATLSQGQRQLLAFARALAFSPSILILDEATANIDTETEALIQNALSRITKNRTTIVIAHRLSTIQHADTIIVLHKGKIREMGSHNDLISKKKMYYDLYNLQYT